MKLFKQLAIVAQFIKRLEERRAIEKCVTIAEVCEQQTDWVGTYQKRMRKLREYFEDLLVTRYGG